MKKAGSSLAREYYQWLVLVQVRFDLETSTVVKVKMISAQYSSNNGKN